MAYLDLYTDILGLLYIWFGERHHECLIKKGYTARPNAPTMPLLLHRHVADELVFVTLLRDVGNASLLLSLSGGIVDRGTLATAAWREVDDRVDFLSLRINAHAVGGEYTSACAWKPQIGRAAEKHAPFCKQQIRSLVCSS